MVYEGVGPKSRAIRTLEGHTNVVNAAAVTPDGRRAISASDDQTLRLWDLSTGQSICSLEGHTDVVNAVAVTPLTTRAILGQAHQAVLKAVDRAGRFL